MDRNDLDLSNTDTEAYKNIQALIERGVVVHFEEEVEVTPENGNTPTEEQQFND
jgi:hypothetical protein